VFKYTYFLCVDYEEVEGGIIGGRAEDVEDERWEVYWFS
jgi:hypothetical protein